MCSSSYSKIGSTDISSIGSTVTGAIASLNMTLTRKPEIILIDTPVSNMTIDSTWNSVVTNRVKDNVNIILTDYVQDVANYMISSINFFTTNSIPAWSLSSYDASTSTLTVMLIRANPGTTSGNVRVTIQKIQ